jgi:hypothetical protein
MWRAAAALPVKHRRITRAPTTASSLPPIHAATRAHARHAASPRHISARLSRLSASRQARPTLAAHAVLAWLASHAHASAGVSALHLDLGHHTCAHDFGIASLDRLLQALPQLSAVHMVGTVEGTDAYEPLGECAASCAALAGTPRPCAHAPAAQPHARPLTDTHARAPPRPQTPQTCTRPRSTPAAPA